MKNNPKTCDFLIIGGGVLGLNIALALKRRYPDTDVVLLEKEEKFANHASGRNSGVLHAGFYYDADSFKARFTKAGNKILTQYCLDKKLRINRCGKLVVAKNEQDLKGLKELARRGRVNGIELHELDIRQAREIEPKVKTVEQALFSPETAVVDPVEVVNSLVKDARAANIECLSGTRYLKHKNKIVRTSQGLIEAKYVVNTAGLYADKIARDFGFSKNYKILPFKGLYLYSNLPPGALRTHIYPVPDLDYPFLGVHYTVTVDGKIKIGPTAIPAFWRENYSGFENFNLAEFIQVLSSEMQLFVNSKFDFKKVAFTEARKMFRRHLVRQASYLLEGVRPRDYTRWGEPGIRAQLYDIREKKLVMDFCLEGDDQSFHVLNAVSPAFTASMPFSEFICDEIGKRLLK
ncbi:MAG: L-2-hydroxyglutarate oxidase [Deltaproteobacteria bacterium]|nr:L-2-hydroxyglutarate oxidase [Deltaproteobacteria bacterium]